jgi:hypothetical protein
MVKAIAVIVAFGLLASGVPAVPAAAEPCEYSCTMLRAAAKAPKFIRDAYLARASKAQIEACGHKCFSRKEREELK